jgi:hypothetical protein
MVLDLGASAGSQRPASARAAAVTTALLWSLALAAPPALQGFARARRVMETSEPVASGGVVPVTAANGRAVLEEWLRRGVAGRTVLHVGAFLHSVTPAGFGRTAAPLEAKAGEEAALRDAIRGAASDQSYLWAAVELGIARRIVFVEPRKAILSRASDLDRPPPGPGEPLDLGVRGLDRVAYDRVPRLPEPVLLDVAASWFEEGDPEALWAELQAAGLRADVVTLNRLGGSDDVRDGARERLAAFAARFAQAARGTSR